MHSMLREITKKNPDRVVRIIILNKFFFIKKGIVGQNERLILRQEYLSLYVR